MNKEECMEALSKHANIKPVITSTGKFSRFFRANEINKLENLETVHAFTIIMTI